MRHTLQNDPFHYDANPPMERLVLQPTAAPAPRSMWRTITEILCGECLSTRNAVILSRLFGNGQITCERCGYRVDQGGGR